ncbi:4-hydroxy-tetrahydrodipicolinate reductase [Sphingosinicella sp. CPCC 101087]|uniref:4-hydroxy-tetrahydrodipicolinate reductase n=1 Tax=Sphingosinicella sp. CPCC 101087 TaxID=2497754 RepID=UPI00101CE4EF|nr:4-hydroxy-tetrahydrodipicolinate reductase [Sphingosinicella sp. CPCC 101087]
MTRIGILGASGRMGRAIAALLQASVEARLAGTVGRGEDPEPLAAGSDVLIDFTGPDAIRIHLDAAVANRTPIVIGTTGLEPAHHQAIDLAARKIPVLQSANMSLGVNLLAFLVREAARRLDDEWDIEILEMHHRHKVDAPSGTALLLGEAAAQGRGIALDGASDRGRDGLTGPREPGRVGFASLRGGSVAGDHMVVFAGDSERIELGHRAESREVFARGALQAAIWLHQQPHGRYDMTDLLGLKLESGAAAG